MSAPNRCLYLTGIGRLVTQTGLGVLCDAELLMRDGQVAWMGPRGAPVPIGVDEVVETLDCEGGAVLPGFIDCHTHLVFGGDRAHEFGLRSAGATYEEIARAGGGIQHTVRATRAASFDALVQSALPRLDAMLARGVTTVEIKSGYGLELETELKMLRVARALNAQHPIRIVTTFLGAHTVPPEFAGRQADYVDYVVDKLLPRVAEEKLATFCDVFCEEVAFGTDASRRVLEAGLALGLRPKLHAEQLRRIGGTQLGVALGAVSVDHLEQIIGEDIAALAESETVAVLLPGATLYLGLEQWAPARALLDAGVPVALATDMNPGSCMCDNLPLMTTLGCVRLGMSPDEALLGITLAAAQALGLGESHGALEPGRAGDCVVLGVRNEVQLPYRFGDAPIRGVIVGGRVVVGPGRDV